MSRHRYGIILGSTAADDSRLTAATAALARTGTILARSEKIRAPSIEPDARGEYVNQALLLASSLSRDAFRGRARQIEQRLGRDRSSGTVEIDIDLVCEFDAGGEMRWAAESKLGHSLFRHLLQRVAPGSDE